MSTTTLCSLQQISSIGLTRPAVMAQQIEEQCIIGHSCIVERQLHLRSWRAKPRRKVMFSSTEAVHENSSCSRTRTISSRSRRNSLQQWHLLGLRLPNFMYHGCSLAWSLNECQRW